MNIPDVLLINDMYYLVVFILGTMIGSFLNVLSDRLITGESLVFSRSHCDHCSKPLGAFNLIPFLSFLLQKGKSACCREKLSYYYPFSEFLSGAAFVFAANYSRLFINFSTLNVMSFVYLATMLSFFIVILLADAKYRLIPDKIVFPAIGFAFLFLVAFSAVDLYIYRQRLLSDTLGKYLIQAGVWNQHFFIVIKQFIAVCVSSLCIGGFFLGLILIWEKLFKHEGMGYGDIKLGILIGLFNGFPNNILAIFLGFLFGAIYSMFFIALKKKTMKDTIPFGPFLIMGSFVALIWGEQLLSWYFGLYI